MDFKKKLISFKQSLMLISAFVVFTADASPAGQALGATSTTGVQLLLRVDPPQPLPWYQAGQACRAAGGRLRQEVTSHLTAVGRLVADGEQLWLGGRNVRTPLRWLDGTLLYEPIGCFPDDVIIGLVQSATRDIPSVHDCFVKCRGEYVALKSELCLCVREAPPTNTEHKTVGSCPHQCAGNLQDKCGSQSSYSVYKIDSIPYRYRPSPFNPDISQCAYLYHNGGTTDLKMATVSLKFDLCGVGSILRKRALCQKCSTQGQCHVTIHKAYTTWNQASDWCRANDMTLATLTPGDLRNYFAFQPGTQEFYWVGLRSDVHLAWLDGTPVETDLLNTSPGSGQGNCLSVARERGTGRLSLRLDDCYKRIEFLCDSEMKSNGITTTPKMHPAIDQLSTQSTTRNPTGNGVSNVKEAAATTITAITNTTITTTNFLEKSTSSPSMKQELSISKVLPSIPNLLSTTTPIIYRHVISKNLFELSTPTTIPSSSYIRPTSLLPLFSSTSSSSRTSSSCSYTLCTSMTETLRKISSTQTVSRSSDSLSSSINHQPSSILVDIDTSSSDSETTSSSSIARQNILTTPHVASTPTITIPWPMTIIEDSIQTPNSQGEIKTLSSFETPHDLQKSKGTLNLKTESPYWTSITSSISLFPSIQPTIPLLLSSVEDGGKTKRPSQNSQYFQSSFTAMPSLPLYGSQTQASSSTPKTASSILPLPPHSFRLASSYATVTTMLTMNSLSLLTPTVKNLSLLSQSSTASGSQSRTSTIAFEGNNNINNNKINRSAQNGVEITQNSIAPTEAVKTGGFTRETSGNDRFTPTLTSGAKQGTGDFPINGVTPCESDRCVTPRISEGSNDGDGDTLLAIYIGVGVVLLILLSVMSVVCVLFWRRRTRKSSSLSRLLPKLDASKEPSHFRLTTLPVPPPTGQSTS